METTNNIENDSVVNQLILGLLHYGDNISTTSNKSKPMDIEKGKLVIFKNTQGVEKQGIVKRDLGNDMVEIQDDILKTTESNMVNEKVYPIKKSSIIKVMDVNIKEKQKEQQLNNLYRDFKKIYKNSLISNKEIRWDDYKKKIEKLLNDGNIEEIKKIFNELESMIGKETYTKIIKTPIESKNENNNIITSYMDFINEIKKEDLPKIVKSTLNKTDIKMTRQDGDNSDDIKKAKEIEKTIKDIEDSKKSVEDGLKKLEDEKMDDIESIKKDMIGISDKIKKYKEK